MASEGEFVTIDGIEIELNRNKIWVHGDRPAAVEMEERIRKDLKHADITVIASEMVCLLSTNLLYC